MILSLFVYTFMALSFFVLGKQIVFQEYKRLNMYQKYDSFWSFDIFLIIILFGFFSGIRYNVGVDYMSYLTDYLDISIKGWTVRESFEQGFVFIMRFFSDLGLHYSVFFSFWAIIQIFFLYYSLKDCKYVYPYLGLILMLSPLFLTLMNGIRQTVVCCLFVYLIKFVAEKRFLPFLVGILLGSLIHKSAFLLLPFFFIASFPLSFRKPQYNVIILIVCAIIGSFPSWVNLLTSLEDVFNLLGYERYGSDVEALIEDERQMSWGPVRLILFFKDILIIWYYPKVKDLFNSQKKIDIYFHLFFWGTCLYNLLVETSIIFTRPIMYLTIFSYIIAVFVLYGLKFLRLHSAFYFCSFVFFSYIYLVLFKLYISGVTDSTTFYKFFFI